MILKMLARKVIDREIRGGTSPISEPKSEKPKIPPESESLREKIERMLSDGPRPYTDVLAACGGNEDQIRAAIRGWRELVSTTTGEATFWEIRSAVAVPAVFAVEPVILAERIGMRFEAEIPDEKGLGSPVFTYRGHILAWEADPPHIRLYAWCLVNLFPGRPLTVDIDSTARLLSLSPREVREALARLVKDGDLVRTWEGRREWYRLNIRYPVNGGKDETGD